MTRYPPGLLTDEEMRELAAITREMKGLSETDDTAALSDRLTALLEGLNLRIGQAKIEELLASLSDE